MKVKIPYHNYFFLFGCFFYLILPIIIAKNGIISDAPGGHLLDNMYDSRYDKKYFSIVCFLLFSFYAGSFSIYLLPHKKQKEIKNKKQKRRVNVLKLLTPIVCVFSIFLILKFPDIKTVTIDDSIIGFTCTMILILSFFVLYNDIQGYKRKSFLFFTSYFFILIFLLRSGTRMYFLIPSIMFLIYAKEKSYLTVKKIIVLIALILCVILFIGIWRIGISDISMMLYIFFAEPTFTWLSAASFLENNPNLPIFSMPYNFLSSFITFIPQFIFDDKKSLIMSIPFEYDSPLGATSIFCSLIGNFGILGSSVFLFIMGAFSTIIYFKTKNNKFIYIYYIAYCAIIPFQFFRDNFGIVHKIVFFALFLFPLTIIICSQLFYSLLKIRILK